MSYENLLNILNSDYEYRNNSINLNASENYTSARVKKIITHPAYDNYTFPPAGGAIQGVWDFHPKPYFEQISDYITNVCNELLCVRYVDSRPKGGQAAEIAVLLAFCEKGDTVFYVDENDGGHFGLNLIADKCGIRLVPLLFDHSTHLLEIEKNVSHMLANWKKNDRKLVIIGQSFVLRKQPYKQFAETVKSQIPDIILSCDISHALGLVVGGQYPNPIKDGFDVLHASTHKTFPGPQKALIALADVSLKHQSLLERTVSPGLLSNCGTTEVYALALAFEEMKAFGREYALAVCQNARFFAKFLAQNGFIVTGEQFDYTETHQVWVQIGSEVAAWHAASLLHEANIRAFPTKLPFYTKAVYGLRLGTSALTRRGFEPKQFERIAEIMKDILLHKLDPITRKGEVARLMADYPIDSMPYSFDRAPATIL